MNREKMHFFTNSHLHRNSATPLCLLPIQIRQPGFPITDSEVWCLHCLAEGYLEGQNLSIKRELCQVLSVASPNFQILPVAFQVPKKISHENHQYLLPGYPQLWWCFCQLLLLQRMQCHWKTTQCHNSCHFWGRQGIIKSRLWDANLNIKLYFQIHWIVCAWMDVLFQQFR